MVTFADWRDHEVAADVTRLPRAFLAVSYAADGGPFDRDPDGPGGEHRVHAAGSMVTTRPVRAVGSGTQVWLNGQGHADAPGTTGAFSVLMSCAAGGHALAAELGHLLARTRHKPLAVGPAAAMVLREQLPPFAVVSCAGMDQPVIAATDLMGCRHLYWHQGEGWAGLSTSALALACAAAAPPDREGLAVRSMLGFHLGSSSPFAGVAKVGPAGACSLGHGRVEVTQYADSCPEVAPGASPEEVTRSAVRLLRSCGQQAVELFPEAVIELSGGLDSKIQLAAIPRPRRAGLRAVTVHGQDSHDLQIARRLAAAARMDHHVVPVAARSELTPADAWALVRSATLRHDCSGSPAEQALLASADEQLGTEPRIHPVGGGIASGFYYPGQRQHGEADAELVARFASARLLARDAVDAACLGPDLADWARATAIRQVSDVVTGYHCDWLAATDQFYARERLVRRAGLRLSANSTERTLVGSLLHSEFGALARQVPSSLKRNSQFMARVLAELDPELSRLPLDIASRLAGPATAASALRPPVAGMKVVQKAHRRVAGPSRPGAGPPFLAGLLLEHWRREPHLLDGLPRTELVDGEWLSRLLEGTSDAVPATVSYLANLAVMTDAATVATELPVLASPAAC